MKAGEAVLGAWLDYLREEPTRALYALAVIADRTASEGVMGDLVAASTRFLDLYDLTNMGETWH